ncbi:isochorismatase-like protein [Aureococcus anophagefferens]|nr:isochorismatase-like protein [Aureococcus anophagefferens]
MAKSILALALLAASSDAFQPKAAAPRATVAVSGIRSFLRRYAKGSDPLARRQHWRRREQKRTKIVGVGGPRLLRRRGGGAEIKAETTALLLIEYQSEFTTEGGKLHDAVKDSMVRLRRARDPSNHSAAQAATGMLEKSAKVAAAARDKGVTVIHAPISFAADRAGQE